jgi:hypothetical protein
MNNGKYVIEYCVGKKRRKEGNEEHERKKEGDKMELILDEWRRR